ncbi:MAG: YigZ family protein [Cytophagales bacterium]|nr:MAG: YigZ family protein [Cytophagales bacterium]
MEKYITLAQPSEGNYRERGSKFLAFAYPVENETMVKTYLQQLKKKYPDAAHHCYAYIYGYDPIQIKANDDGEPAHSAGTPILNQLKAQQLHNVLVVVVRYFGGVKLGVSGLIQAYKTATIEALEAATLLEKQVEHLFEMQFAYEKMNDIMKVVKQYQLTILTQESDIFACKIALKIPQKYYEEAVSLLSKAAL